jgi:hypothetical protein
MNHPFQIETRQKEETLFLSTDRILVPSGSMGTGPFEVSGYSAVIFFAISDQPFQLRVQEAVQSSGPFTETTTLSSSLDAITGLQKAMYKIQPSGDFMRAFLDNLGASAEQFLQFRMAGLPVAGNLATGAGQSGYSGLSGVSGYSGAPSVSGFSGYSGVGGPGASGFSGYSGTRASATPEAATFVVSPTPGVGDFTTIQAAVTNLPVEGGLIFVREGTYLEQVTFPVDKDVFLVFAAGAVMNFGATVLPAFVVPNGLASRRHYELWNPQVVYDGTAGQDFIQILDTGGWVTMDVYECNVYRPAILVNFVAYDVTYSRAHSVVFHSGIATPLDNVSILIKAPAVAGTYGGAAWVGFNDTELSPDVPVTSWTLDADADIVYSSTSSERGLSLSGGTAIDGFYFLGAYLTIGNGDFHINGVTWAGGSGLLARTSGGLGVNSRIICEDTGSQLSGYTFNLCYKLGNSSANIPTMQAINLWLTSNLAMANPTIELVGKGSVVTACYFAGQQPQGCVKITDVKFCKVHDNTFSTGITGKSVIESGTADENDIHDNAGLTNGTGYTIIGPKTKVNGSIRAEKASTTTNALVEVVPTIANPKGVMGIGTIKNTDGANSLDIKESFTDAFGTVSSITTTVLPGNSYMLDLQTNMGTGLTPYVSYKAEVIDTVAASHATYLLQFSGQGAIQ